MTNSLIDVADAKATVAGQSDWVLGDAPGANRYVHAFGPASAGPFALLKTAATPLSNGEAPGVTTGGARNAPPCQFGRRVRA